jgi:nucleoside-diphosphate-sugar epimerase
LTANILIIGGTGSIGFELAKDLSIEHNVTIFSRDEHKQNIRKREGHDIDYVLGDIRKS